MPHPLPFLRLRLATAAMIAALALASCDSGPSEGPPGSVRVHVTFLDGTPALADLLLQHFDPDRPPFTPPRHEQSARAVGGVHTFTGVPPGEYEVYTTPIVAQHSPEPIGRSPVRVTVSPEGQAVVEALVVYREVGEWVAVASLESRAPDDLGADQRGLVELIRYDLGALRIGSRWDMVRRVKTRREAIHIIDERATEATLAVYPIPEGVPWGFGDPGELTYDFFRTGMEPAASYRVPLHPRSAGRNEALLHFELDPALFFTARNGIAVFVEAENLVYANLIPMSLTLTYVWEDEF